jgi:hypothetical protein
MRLILSLLALAANISAADFSACAELDKLRKKSRDATDELNELESAKSNYQSCDLKAARWGKALTRAPSPRQNPHCGIYQSPAKMHS